MIWPRGPAPEFLISVDNSYSIRFRNIRIHETQNEVRRAAVLLLGGEGTGGHGRCANIVWENLIVRNDAGQPGVAVLAAKGCGSHRFIAPDLENFRVLIEWQGGQIDLVVPYTERAGQFAVNCNLDSHEDDAYFNTFGGIVDSAKSGFSCAIRSTTRNFNSFGTRWGPSTDLAVNVYSLPARPVHFYGMAPGSEHRGQGKFTGVAGWQQYVNAPQQPITASRKIKIEVPAHGRATATVEVPGVSVGDYWARATLNGDSKGIQLSAFVSAAAAATIVAQNMTDTPIELSGIFTVECGVA